MRQHRIPGDQKSSGAVLSHFTLREVSKVQLFIYMRKFAQSPLPFQGQKRKFTREFANALGQYPRDGVYVDLFGGSGLLSHTVKS